MEGGGWGIRGEQTHTAVIEARLFMTCCVVEGMGRDCLGQDARRRRLDVCLDKERVSVSLSLVLMKKRGARAWMDAVCPAGCRRRKRESLFFFCAPCASRVCLF